MSDERMKSKLISCIITTYKRPVKILGRAIQSVLRQKYVDIELIVVNDDPYDNDLNYEIEEYISEQRKNSIINIECIQCWGKRGACAARNLGLSMAKGEFVAFLDDDDEWLDTKLAKQIEMMQDDVALVYCSHFEIMPNGQRLIVCDEFSDAKASWSEFEKLLCYNYIGSTSYPLLRTSAIREVGGFTVGLKASQDHDLWLRIAQNYQIRYIDEPLVNYYVSDISISKSMSNKLSGYNFLLEKYKNVYVKNKEILNYRLNYLSYCCLKYKNVSYFWLYYKQAVRVSWNSKYNLMFLKKILHKISKKGRYIHTWQKNNE